MTSTRVAVESDVIDSSAESGNFAVGTDSSGILRTSTATTRPCFGSSSSLTTKPLSTALPEAAGTVEKTIPPLGSSLPAHIRAGNRTSIDSGTYDTSGASTLVVSPCGQVKVGRSCSTGRIGVITASRNPRSPETRAMRRRR